MVGGKILTAIVGTICPPGKPHSEKFQNPDFYPPRPPNVTFLDKAPDITDSHTMFLGQGSGYN